MARAPHPARPSGGRRAVAKRTVTDSRPGHPPTRRPVLSLDRVTGWAAPSLLSREDNTLCGRSVVLYARRPRQNRQPPTLTTGPRAEVPVEFRHVDSLVVNQLRLFFVRPSIYPSIRPSFLPSVGTSTVEVIPEITLLDELNDGRSN